MVSKFFASKRSRSMVEMALEQPLIFTDLSVMEANNSVADNLNTNNTDISETEQTFSLTNVAVSNGVLQDFKIISTESSVTEDDAYVDPEAVEQPLENSADNVLVYYEIGVNQGRNAENHKNDDCDVTLEDNLDFHTTSPQQVPNNESTSIMQQDVTEINLTRGTNQETDTEVEDNLHDSDYEGSKDDNFENSETSEDEQNENNQPNNEGQKRKRKPDKTEWDREKTKLRRMRGEEYLGYTRTRDGKVSHNKIREPKKLGPPCTSTKCLKFKTRFCNTITLDERSSIFQNFWRELDWDQKKIYITSLMKKKATARKFVPGESRRSFTYEYFLRVNDEIKQVCKKMFLATLGLKEWMVATWCSENTHGMHSSRVVVNANRQLDRSQRKSVEHIERQKTFLRSFLNSLPKMPSHYCRKDTKKHYLETDFGSKSNIYRLYLKHCNENTEQALSIYTFWETFEEMNLALFCPKKDQCNVCVAYNVGNFGAEEYRRHTELKDQARQEKNEDKNKAETGQHHAFVMDVQAVKLCPVNNANKFYFKTKLKMHNFTIYNLASHQCTNYWWNESEADLVASVFTSIIIHHLEKYCTDSRPIVLWSDGCPYQNKNAVLANALSNYAEKYLKVVSQKFLEPGHTQMECDSVHSVIERKLKNKDIVLPYDYVTITKTARIKPFPYDVEYLQHTFFKNYDDQDKMRYKSIRPGRGTHDPTVTNLRVLNYGIDGKIKYKLHFTDDLKDLPQRSKEVNLNTPLKPLYQRRLEISKLKYDHLQSIKTTLPPESHHFYDTLPFE